MNRRGFIQSIGVIAAAPAIVRAASIMPVRAERVPVAIYPDPAWGGGNGYDGLMSDDYTPPALVMGDDGRAHFFFVKPSDEFSRGGELWHATVNVGGIWSPPERALI